MIDGIVLMEKKADQIEYVGPDDTITTDVILLIVWSDKDPKVFSYHRKDDETKVGEVPIVKLLKMLPPEQLAEIANELKKRS